MFIPKTLKRRVSLPRHTVRDWTPKVGVSHLRKKAVLLPRLKDDRERERERERERQRERERDG